MSLPAPPCIASAWTSRVACSIEHSFAGFRTAIGHGIPELQTMKLDDIQAALREEGLDGWLFFDHHFRDPLAYRVLGFKSEATPTRRWYYLIPANREPQRLVHRIE